MAEGQVCREAVRRQAQIASRSHAATRAIDRAPSSLQRVTRLMGNQGMHRLLTGGIQAKLTVGAPDDEYEREADRVADEVMRMPEPAVSEHLQQVPADISRKCAACESEKEDEPDTVVQAKVASPPQSSASSPPSSTRATPAISADLASYLTSTRGGGESLPAAARAFFEPRFGHDFGGVRVHANSRAHKAASGIHARAFTLGSDIYFAQGAYALANREGQQLLAHELTHVVQQGQTAAWSPGVEMLPGGGQHVRLLPALGDRGDAFEREADAAHVPGAVYQRTPAASLQRLELPRPVPACGTFVTDVDILPPRPRALVECGLPPSLLVTRANVVGRRRTAGSTGRGRIIFNLHIGYYEDPVTGRYCGVVSDSTRCLTPGGCLIWCLPTLREVIDAILDFLAFLGIVILLILLAILLRGGRVPAPAEGPMGPPLLAGRGEEPETAEA